LEFEILELVLPGRNRSMRRRPSRLHATRRMLTELEAPIKKPTVKDLGKAIPNFKLQA
jgi:hypothetical protein